MRDPRISEDGEFIHDLNFGTLALTLVVNALLLGLAPVLPLFAGLLGLALAWCGLKMASEPGRLRLWNGWWGPKFGLFDGLILFVCAVLPVLAAGVVLLS